MCAIDRVKEVVSGRGTFCFLPGGSRLVEIIEGSWYQYLKEDARSEFILCLYDALTAGFNLY